MTSEERKQMIKDLIDRIPTAKNDLFAFPINWNYVDKSLVEQRVNIILKIKIRKILDSSGIFFASVYLIAMFFIFFKVKPWVSKKITDYIGEEEASLVDFVCEKVTSKTDPQKILSDIAMVTFPAIL